MTLDAALSAAPNGLRQPLLDAFRQIQTHFVERRWEAAELNGGKFCECVYSILHGLANNGQFLAKPSKPSNMVVACRDLEQAVHLPRSIRIQIPRVLVALYEIRNNRNVGHVGGDVDPSAMDAGVVLAMSKWVMAEFVRYFHNLDPNDAAEIVAETVARTTAAVWAFEDMRRVLDTTLPMKSKTLLLLHSSGNDVSEADLCKWLERDTPAVFRRDVLQPMHEAALIHFDRSRGTVRLSPTGVARAEEIAMALQSQ